MRVTKIYLSPINLLVHRLSLTLFLILGWSSGLHADHHLHRCGLMAHPSRVSVNEAIKVSWTRSVRGVLRTTKEDIKISTKGTRIFTFTKEGEYSFSLLDEDDELCVVWVRVGEPVIKSRGVMRGSSPSKSGVDLDIRLPSILKSCAQTYQIYHGEQLQGIVGNGHFESGFCNYKFRYTSIWGLGGTATLLLLPYDEGNGVFNYWLAESKALSFLILDVPSTDQPTIGP